MTSFWSPVGMLRGNVGSKAKRAIRSRRHRWMTCRCLPVAVFVSAACLALDGCGSSPLVAYSVDTPPLALLPATQAGITDQRARFREIYCAVLDAGGSAIPDARPCEDALSRVGTEPPATGKPV